MLGAVNMFKDLIKPERCEFFDSSSERNRVLGGYLVLLSYVGIYFCEHVCHAPNAGYRFTDCHIRCTHSVIACAVTGSLHALFHYVLLVPLPVGEWFA